MLMNNYKIIKHKNQRRYTIFEITTQQIVKEFKELKKAKKLNQHLNSGGAFDGLTPPFMCREFRL